MIHKINDLSWSDPEEKKPRGKELSVLHALCEYLKEAEVYRVAFEKEKELTDRALKLAEIGKPKSNWELQGILGMAVFVLGFLAGGKGGRICKHILEVMPRWL